MGISSSKPQRYDQNPSPSPSLLLSSSSSSYPNPPNSLPSTSSSSSSSYSYSFPPPSQPPPPPPNCYSSYPQTPPPPPYTNSQPPYQNPPQLNHYPMYPPPPPNPLNNPYYFQQNHYSYTQSNSNQWQQPWIRPHMMMPQQPLQQQVLLPLVPFQEAKKVRNDVNVHKDTIKIQIDDHNPDYHLVSFTFDALVDGRITIFYFAKEGANCRYSPLYPDACMPVTVPFQKGVGQRFHQPSGTGIDLGFFDLEDLSRPSPGDQVFPLVIYAEACQPPLPMIEDSDHPLPSTSRAQISEAVLERNNQGAFQVKVVKQILWIDGERYELREIYGIGNSTEPDLDDNESGKECVICMTEPKDTAVLPCRHMCMCNECANELRRQTNKCPICRQHIEELLEIKVSKREQ
ncbi:hypothetical protein MKX03_019758 [Papaver bracteatum]|nr:hypothetical protein MKX03_019758 [Papaver bracteatum]